MNHSLTGPPAPPPPPAPCADVQRSPLLAPCLFPLSPLVFFLSVLPVLYIICDMLCSKCIPSNISGLAKSSMTALPRAGHRVIQHCHACVINIRQSKRNSCLIYSDSEGNGSWSYLYAYLYLSTHIPDNPIAHSIWSTPKTPNWDPNKWNLYPLHHLNDSRGISYPPVTQQKFDLFLPSRDSSGVGGRDSLVAVILSRAWCMAPFHTHLSTPSY